MSYDVAGGTVERGRACACVSGPSAGRGRRGIDVHHAFTADPVPGHYAVSASPPRSGAVCERDITGSRRPAVGRRDLDGQ